MDMQGRTLFTLRKEIPSFILPTYYAQTNDGKKLFEVKSKFCCEDTLDYVRSHLSEGVCRSRIE